MSDSFSAEEMLKRISKFNDGVQAAIFNPNALAPTFPESAITRPFRFNAYYDETDAPDVDEDTYRLALDVSIPLIGMLKRKGEKILIDTALKGLKKRVESIG